MEKFYRLPLVLEPEPEGGFTITCPILPELITAAESLSDVPAAVADALAVVLEIYEDEDRPLPVFLGPVSSANLFYTEALIPVAG
jgi:antitoxin HicB